MAELADAYDSGSYEATRAGSSPVRCTIINKGDALKRLVLILLIIFLSGCGSSNLSWSDVENSYAALEETVENPAETAETFLSYDFIELVERIKTNMENFSIGIKKNETELADTLYEDAIKLEKAASLTESDNATFLKTLASKVKKMVIAAYDKNSDFDGLKYEIDTEIEEVNSWSREDWLQVEKKARIRWNTIESVFADLTEETIDNLTPKDDVAEYEIEEYKDIIVNNYKKIANGVTEDTLELAKQIYSSGVALKEYTEDVEGDAAASINTFANQTIDYVKECFGEKSTDSNYDFPKQIEIAKKWTLSTLNELTMMMRKD